MSPHRAKLPVVIVCGLHAEARREVVEGLLRDVPHSVALHHDLSSVAAARSGVRCVTPAASRRPMRHCS